MKYKWYWLFGIIMGLLCFVQGSDTVKEIRFSEIVLYPAFLSAECRPEFLSQITHWYMPLLVFQIIYGVYIYRHFCSASIYFFSRNVERKRWFFHESIKLLGFIVLYLVSMVITGIIVKGFTYDILWDTEGFMIFVYYIVIHSLYLFAVTLAINVVSIRFGSSIGFISVISLNTFFISIYSILEEIIREEILYTQYIWLFKINPFAHLVFKIHSSSLDNVNSVINVYGTDFDLNMSVILYGVLCIVLVVLGCIICEKHEFIRSSMEEE